MINNPASDLRPSTIQKSARVPSSHFPQTIEKIVVKIFVCFLHRLESPEILPIDHSMKIQPLT